MTLLLTLNKNHICNVAFIIVISKVIMSKFFIGIVTVALFVRRISFKEKKFCIKL